FISPNFVTDAESQEAVLEDAYILLTTQKIASLEELLPLLEQVLQAGKPLLIIAEDVEGQALSTLVVNSIRKTIKVAAVKAPGFGDRRKAMLQDMSIATGGELLAPELGDKLGQFSRDVRGAAGVAQRGRHAHRGRRRPQGRDRRPRRADPQGDRGVGLRLGP